MVVPVGVSDHMQQLVIVTRTAAGYEYDDLRMPVRFVPLVEGVEPG
jgi:protein-L-isoaspartate(D-aspartate) O-methyltransferase